ncbi:chromate efflux transporter [Tropicimonas sp. IMCC6043]|uniref:chromate efflux transporter n=1 Tax=Tropicimonas sp. IMCC6043 TaxID=2510645 RepID=UPI00101DD763|nr:chromate efflux transporter [Tropicimonas sp. IMCC6043]RYH09747.1 chromate efflux transporter [Tropicimonas sp. IMCC6043]
MTDPQPSRRNGSPSEVFAAFLMLGLTSFGGPIAHLGYFRTEFVTRRGWLDERGFADLVALCQFLPGPASSQVGFAIGLMRAGPLGAAAAFAAFTLPSALLMIAFALSSAALDGSVGHGVVSGLKIVAVAIVAQAVLGMARALCPDRERAAIAVLAVAMLAALPGALGMIGAILAGALAGFALGRGETAGRENGLPPPLSRRGALACLAGFAALLLALPVLAGLTQGLALFDAFYRAAALVFGGGHVVLPLLESEVVRPGWISAEDFLVGYGAAQAMPGPLFSFAAYLGALGPAPNGLAGAAIALAAIFLPGFLLLLAVLPFWDALRRRRDAQSALQGANAAVVGILGAALYDPVFTAGIGDMADFALALACFVLLVAWKAPPWVAVLVAALGGIVLSLA